MEPTNELEFYGILANIALFAIGIYVAVLVSKTQATMQNISDQRNAEFLRQQSELAHRRELINEVVKNASSLQMQILILHFFIEQDDAEKIAIQCKLLNSLAHEINVNLDLVESVVGAQLLTNVDNHGTLTDIIVFTTDLIYEKEIRDAINDDFIKRFNGYLDEVKKRLMKDAAQAGSEDASN
ncbi:hypothetical protein [Phaeocystidibacter luteus]|uniref:Uncharacterized protein n=1 Tax=Phaeocystidibacter luteus TaxID=911197 RepID=A0A6N6RLU3_9FLAO|nr:hypothetical protein [Phaeocystidibacter luteus]KAB2814549.1 hypothetical protein F8C67_02080 [Phaeocystidibacter luteus]